MTDLFKPSAKPRVFGLAPGIDFPAALVNGLRQRSSDHPPEAMARVELFVNTRRMARRVQTLFEQGPACILPRIRLVTDLAKDPSFAHLPPAAPRLRRRLQVVQLLTRLLEADPDLAPRFSLFDLADSLIALMEEMHGEGVDPDAITKLDVSDQSGHWDRALRFIQVVQGYFQADALEPDAETRQRAVVMALTERWKTNPPQHPILVAGSTGSRGTTALFMQAVAKLPQGAVLLPGFDTDMARENWAELKDPLKSEDHPQFRFRRLMAALDQPMSSVRTDWSNDPAPHPARNRLVSLALRPAPVTDQWLRDGPALGNLQAACTNVTLIEADSLREEALAIALVLRKAVEDGKTAALIAPDRVLARRVTAALSRWKILPDDSAGIPLQVSPPGRLLRQILGLYGQTLTAEALLALLKHPLVNTGNRGQHMLWTDELELFVRRKGGPFPTRAMVHAWASEKGEYSDDARAWADWLFDALEPLADARSGALPDLLELHLATAENLSNGPTPPETCPLWANDAGREALRLMTEFRQEAPLGNELTATDYRSLFEGVVALGEVRNPDAPHPQVRIWGTLEARVQGADLVILSGLNEGTWPENPTPDPWMNRQMRKDAGLLLPERRIGLAAHDFQQAIAAPEVVLSRSRKSDDAETVASRWLNRLTNLLQGLPDQGGKAAFDQMLAKGSEWLALADALEEPRPIPKAKRPSPAPPTDARPTRISVTAVKTLIRDPYAIYAQRVLGLRALDPLAQQADAPLRGTVIHKIMEQFHQDPLEPSDAAAKLRLLTISDTVLAEHAPWPTARALWRARIARVADWFLAHERERAKTMSPVGVETRGQVEVALPRITLTAEADRIDRDRTTGELHIFDYKTGTPPKAKEQKAFDKQLLLEAAMLEQGGFARIGKGKVASATYIGLGSKPEEVAAPFADDGVEEAWQGFLRLISSYAQDDKGYTSRRAMQKVEDAGNYDHLARFGEWDLSDRATVEVLK
jgi:double-strand break repair protein AddB